MSAAFLVALAALAPGCGGGVSSEAVKPASEVLADAKAAALSARSVHLASGHPVTLALYLVHRHDAKGWLSKDGTRFDFIRVGGMIYARPAAGGGSGGRSAWSKVPATDQSAGPLASLTLQATFTTGPFASSHGALVNAGETTYRSERVIEIRNRANGNTLYVAARGKPYPVAFIGRGPDAGTLRFDHWNQPVMVTPPN